MAMFTVPTSQVYVDSVTGHRYFYRSGDVIDLAAAVRLGMPGAESPAGAAPFSDAQLAYLAARTLNDLADVSVRVPQADDTLIVAGGVWINVASALNQMPNPDFEDTTRPLGFASARWGGFNGDETLSYETATPISGHASLRVLTVDQPINGDREGAGYNHSVIDNVISGIPFADGTALRYAMRLGLTGSGRVMVGAYYSGPPEDVVLGTVTSPASVSLTTDFAMATGGIDLSPYVKTDRSVQISGLVITIDDVYLGPVPS